jgi:8-oxo-dGTP pyrophosphatase MutT (NUDIX family)
MNMVDEPVCIDELTNNQPFCAGVILFRKNKIITTLNTDGIPDQHDNDVLRIGAVGGGQEPGESIEECAIREAAEELHISDYNIELIHSKVTYYNDMDTGEVEKIQCTDKISPFLFQRQINPHPKTPYKPGLPVGQYIYYSLYIGRILNEDIFPGDDVEGLLLVPLDHWEQLNQSKLEDVLGNHELIERKKIDRKTILYTPTNESFNMAIPLIRKHTELIINS